MSQTTAPKILKLPFILGDLVLLTSAAWVALYAGPLGSWQYLVTVGAVASGAWLMVWPFVLEFRAAAKIAESAALGSVTSKINDLDEVAASITRAVTEWQHLQQSATQTVTAAEHIAERMTTEARNFGEVFTRMNESEKKHLRLEVDKLRRAEGDWLGVALRMLDHIHALHHAGLRSGQRNVIEQLTNFQNACRDAARRIGILAVMPEPGIPFDAALHQPPPGVEPSEGSPIGEILAPGYTFQGQMVRLPMVAFAEKKAVESAPPGEQLPFQ